MTTLAILDLVQAFGAQQVHELPLLVCLHAGEGYTVQQDRLHQALVALLQQLLKGWPRDAAHQITLQPRKQTSS